MSQLSQQTGETRNGVNAVKSTIDGMRVSRDTFINSIATLKTQLKEQNQRLIILNKEKANFEAKKNISSSDSKTSEQMKLDLMNQQISLNQIRDDVKEIKAEVLNIS